MILPQLQLNFTISSIYPEVLDRFQQTSSQMKAYNTSFLFEAKFLEKI